MGTGYDTRGVKFREQNIGIDEIVELDLPNVVEAKQRLYKRLVLRRQQRCRQRQRQRQRQRRNVLASLFSSSSSSSSSVALSNNKTELSLSTLPTIYPTWNTY